ncbi:MAG: hydrogenase maturation protease [Chloroflexota bacterium]
MCSVGATDDRPVTLVLGLGNPILGDDGVGWRVAEEVERRLITAPWLGCLAGPVEVDRLAVGGLAIMERLVGQQRAVLIDAVLDGRPPGTIAVGTLAETDSRLSGHLDSAHDATLNAALDVAVRLGAPLPDEIRVVTVSARRVLEFDEHMTRPVADAVSRAADEVMALLGQPVAMPA